MHSSRVVHLPTYSITDHEEDADHGFHHSPKTIDLLVAGEKLVRSKKPNALVKLRKLVADYPNIPAFKNYLVTYYLVHNKFDEGYALNRQVVKDYPDYLFGKLNLAGEYLFKREYAQIPKILGEKLDIKDLYPHRKVFYSNEVLSFFNVVCRYLIEVGRLDEAEQRIEAAAEIFRENQVVADVQDCLTETRTDHFYKKLNALLEERGEDSLGESYDTTLRTSELPVFTHPEIWALYENDLRIDQAVLKKILALPRKSLLKDLETVLWDSVRRFEYFSALAEETDVWADGKLSFPLHALFLMSELKATEELPFILDYFKQGGQVLDFWYEDHTTETLWHILYHLGANQLDLLQEFMQAPCIYYSSRWIVLSAINQLALHHPERRQEFMGWYGSLLDFFLSNLDDPKVIDPKVNGSLVAELLDIQAKELLPGLKILFDRGLVDWFAVGDYNAVKKEMMFSSYSDWSKHPVFKSVFAHYDHIINTWYSYAPKEEYEKKQEQIRKTWSEKHLEQGALKPPKNNLPDSLRSIPIASKTAKVGRNEPCPCGSGKKYKHCCGKN